VEGGGARWHNTLEVVGKGTMGGAVPHPRGSNTWAGEEGSGGCCKDDRGASGEGGGIRKAEVGERATGRAALMNDIRCVKETDPMHLERRANGGEDGSEPVLGGTSEVAHEGGVSGGRAEGEELSIRKLGEKDGGRRVSEEQATQVCKGGGVPTGEGRVWDTADASGELPAGVRAMLCGGHDGDFKPWGRERG
jgi:hypothetical protein